MSIRNNAGAILLTIFLLFIILRITNFKSINFKPAVFSH